MIPPQNANLSQSLYGEGFATPPKSLRTLFVLKTSAEHGTLVPITALGLLLSHLPVGPQLGRLLLLAALLGARFPPSWWKSAELASSCLP